MDNIRKLIETFISIADKQVTGKGVKPEAYAFIQENEGEFEDLEVKISFGVGNAAAVPWIGFLGYGQSVARGINPALLYFKKQKTLILAYGVSEKKQPLENWPNASELTSINSYFKKHFKQAAEKYGTSYVYYAYSTKTPVNAKTIEKDLKNLIAEYHEAFKHVQEPRVTYNTTRKTKTQSEKYTREQALTELFTGEEKLDRILNTLQQKKNIILQGPPGTGKTFLARRLAYLMLGKKDHSTIQMVQFHQSYAYEDFIQGYRPNDQGKFDLKNGIFYEFCLQAQQNPTQDYFFIIDEINRGNLGKIFGELMLLMEADKRGEEFAIPLTYAKHPGITFYIPANVYIIGTMNTADRSLAMVDYALRRRFAFINVEPGFEKLYEYLVGKGASLTLAENIRKKMMALNEEISAEMGKGFAIGHSYFCAGSKQYDDNWYTGIIENEIAPLLAEYWFDDETKANAQVKKLK